MTSVHWPHLATLVQIRITDQPAYLLHRHDWQNSSLILDLMTLDYGRVSLMAKGGKSSKSRGLFQPFCQLIVSWTGRQELKTLTTIDGTALPVDERLYLPLLYANELIATFLPKQDPNPEIFALYDRLLRQINNENIEAQLREFERSAMQVLGYLPDMGIDAEHGRPIRVDAYYSFQATRGFLECDRGAANVVSGTTINAWNQMQYQDIQVLQVAKTVMRCIIDFNLQGKVLKSRDIYQQIKKRK